MDLELGRPSVERRPAVPAVPKVAIVIPTLNEWENITVLVERVARALDCISWEAISSTMIRPMGPLMKCAV